ncbi:MAG: hypothetical protein JWM11_4148 [Planctomycetaceae bacterium]|nr:hypothetical protein [Planctomycetaceae bacterium]
MTNQTIEPRVDPYLQLLIYVFLQRQLVRRLHFRFLPGDESYNYAAGNMFIGLFDPEAAVEAKAYVEQNYASIKSSLLPVSLEAAGLRFEDAGGFIRSISSSEGVFIPPVARQALSKHPIADAFYVAFSAPNGDCHARIFPLNSIELPPSVGSLIEGFTDVAERLTGAAELRKKQAAANPSPQPSQSSPEPAQPQPAPIPADNPQAPNHPPLVAESQHVEKRPWWKFW